MVKLDQTLAFVQQYFEDEKVLLEDWYHGFYSHAFPGEPVAAMPSLDNIRDAFERWVGNVTDQLYNLICVEWNYPGKSKNRVYQDKVKLAAALADLFISSTWKIPAPIATATLLAQMGLDKVCGTYEGGH